MSLSRPSSELALSWVSTVGLLGRGGLGGVWETGIPLPAWAGGMLSFSVGLAGPSADIWVSVMLSRESPSSFPTSTPAGRTSLPTLPAPVSVLSSGDCRSGLGLLSAFPLTANLPRCCVQMKVPASDPGLYDPGSSVLEHSLHLPKRRESPVRWGCHPALKKDNAAGKSLQGHGVSSHPCY